eukprot:CAMPEP_0168455512 /NCGR_PEP_ID=MMETSP0228-20121227/50788_1 /TAXON_ID=133427 /ORGANISM="Protoceratium reticulatum, Strain CCCM 535 (=CCMP 1889)" /LENGTH=152 /DNA_ID=CAMNT_0008470359 /DNA_START=144 /DNA_END=601 /DNA_ORIENTATION=+
MTRSADSAVFCDDAAAAAEGAEESQEVTSLLAAKLLVEVCARVHTEQRAAWEEGHQHQAYPVVHHARRVEDLRRTRGGAEERAATVRETHLQEGLDLGLLLQGSGLGRRRKVLQHWILGDDDEIVEQSEDKLHQHTDCPRPEVDPLQEGLML